MRYAGPVFGVSHEPFLPAEQAKALLLYAQLCIIRAEMTLKGEFCMAKSANLYARIEPEVKEQAEAILNALGIPASNAITMFYKQIILQRGLPFEVKLPEHPLDVSRLTDAQLDAELEKGYAQYRAGQAVPAQQAFDTQLDKL